MSLAGPGSSKAPETAGLAPEQQRALRYLDRRGRLASASDVCAAAAKAFAAVESALESVDAALAAARPPAGGWTVHQIVDHLVTSHRPAVDQLRAGLAGEDPGAVIPAGLQSDDPFAVAWPALVASLRGVHRDFSDVMSAASDDTVATPLPVLMVVKGKAEDGGTVVYEWLERFDWKTYAVAIKAHCLEHIAQIGRVLEATRGPAATKPFTTAS